MALTDFNISDLASARETPGLSAIPRDALARLPGLKAEAARDLRLGAFLARSPQACMVLLATGSLALLWTSLSAGGGASLKANFAWGALVLIGVVAMTRNYIRGFARSLRRAPLAEAAADLRIHLLYTGAAWGMGAWLVMPDLPAPALATAFAVAPSLGVTLALKNPGASLAFVLPASLITASAALLGVWPLSLWVGGVILAVTATIALVAAVRLPR